MDTKNNINEQIESLKLQANDFVMKKMYHEAIELYKKALELDNTSYDSWFKLGIIYIIIKEYNQAMEAIFEALKLKQINPSSGEIKNIPTEIGSVLTKMKKEIWDTKYFDSLNEEYKILFIVIGAFENTNFVDINKEEFWELKATNSLKNENYQFAIIEFKQALKINPKNAKNWQSLGNTYFFVSDFIEAIKSYNQSLEIEPENTSVLSSLGSSYSFLNKFDKAIITYLKLLEIEPQNKIFLSNLGSAYFQNKDYTKSIEINQKLLEIEPKNSSILWKIGHAYIINNEIEKGNELINKAIKFENEERLEKQRVSEEKIKIETQKEVLSFISHSFRNSLSNGPEIVRETLSLAKKALDKDYEDKLAYKAFNNLAGLYSTFALVETQLDHFQLFVRDEKTLLEQWNKKVYGDKSINYLFALSLKQNISRFLFSENLKEEREKLIPNFSIVRLMNLRKSFLIEILTEDFELLEPEKIIDWVNSNLSCIEIEINDKITGLNKKGVHFLLIYSIISETIFNSIKYSDASEPIFINWNREGAKIKFECTNHFSEESTKYSDSKSGLQFIEYLIKKIDKDILFERRIENTKFKNILEISNI